MTLVFERLCENGGARKYHFLGSKARKYHFFRKGNLEGKRSPKIMVKK